MQINVNTETIKALINFPYFVINSEVVKGGTFYRNEIREIQQYYTEYENGVQFYPKGTKGDYVPSTIHFRNISTLINKEARFMFSQTPEIIIKPKNISPEEKKKAESYQIVVNKILEKSKFSKKLLQSAKDCFIGKRIAILTDISEDDGIKVHFYNSLEFYYETDTDSERITKFVSFEKITDALQYTDVEYLVNRYEEVNKEIYMSSIVYDSAGNILETVIPNKKIQLNYIPVSVVTNDGTLRDKRGISEVKALEEYEQGYSELSNGDIDSENKNMNPVKYTVDMNPVTTKNLPSSAGSYWDLQHDMNINDPNPQVGVLAPNMQHTEAVKTTLERIKNAMYGELEVPDITNETLSGVITSGKSLKALYFGLTVRCNEKLKTWIPALESTIRTVIDLSLLNEELIKGLYAIPDIQEIEYIVKVNVKYALLEDEQEEKASDLNEIAQNARSRKSYLKKWRGDEFETDEQIEDELMQIAIEQNMFDTLSMNTQVQNKMNETNSDETIDKNLEELENEEILKNTKNI